MFLSRKLIALVLVLATSGAAPAFADPPHKRGHDRDRGHHSQVDRGPKHHPGAARHIQRCPPGMVKQNRSCVRPDYRQQHKAPPHAHHAPHRHQAKRPQAHHRPQQHIRPQHQGPRVGQVLRHGKYSTLRDPHRYGLETRRGWNYYRDGQYIYRVDRNSNRILAVMRVVNSR